MLDQYILVILVVFSILIPRLNLQIFNGHILIFNILLNFLVDWADITNQMLPNLLCWTLRWLKLLILLISEAYHILVQFIDLTDRFIIKGLLICIDIMVLRYEFINIYLFVVFCTSSKKKLLVIQSSSHIDEIAFISLSRSIICSISHHLKILIVLFYQTQIVHHLIFIFPVNIGRVLLRGALSRLRLYLLEASRILQVRKSLCSHVEVQARYARWSTVAHAASAVFHSLPWTLVQSTPSDWTSAADYLAALEANWGPLTCAQFSIIQALRFTDDLIGWFGSEGSLILGAHILNLDIPWVSCIRFLHFLMG